MAKSEKTKSVSDKGKSNDLFYYLILASLSVLLYIRIPGFQFTGFDDSTIILDNLDLLGSFSNFVDVVLNDAFFQGGSQHFFRPLQNLTFMFDTVISDGNPSFYHFTNMILHMAAVLLLFKLLRNFGISNISSLFSAALYALSPVMNHAVAWVPGRGDVLMSIFTLVFFISLDDYIKKEKFKYFYINITGLILALLSKESALLLPSIALIYILIRNRKAVIFQKEGLIFSVSYIVISLAYLLFRNTIITTELSNTNFGISEYISNLYFLPEIFGKFLIPVNLSTLPIYSLISTIIGILTSMLFIYLYINSKADKSYLYFGIIWFVLLSSPGMFYTHEFGNFAYNYLEHRAYLPLIGIIVPISVLLNQYIRNNTFKPIIVLYLIILGIISVINTGNYENRFKFYDKAIKDNPESAAMAYLNRGIFYANTGDNKSAVDDFEKAKEIFPEYASAYSNLGLAISNKGVNQEYSIRCLDKAIQLDSSNQLYYFNRGTIHGKFGNPEKAIADYKTAISIKSDFRNAYRNLIYELNRIGNFEEIVKEANTAIKNIPDYNEAYLELGVAKYYLQDTIGACEAWKQSAEFGNTKAKEYYRQVCKTTIE
ncbi:MAG: glycosyltransferase family 39 protein [Candidatus Kapabacteria bacterium]|jgi:tetratricopeptide (TPR) repeat protein|nr:glycosyltransferase family 39 protein [Candidatus Kapabacteria bacterium]